MSDCKAVELWIRIPPDIAVRMRVMDEQERDCFMCILKQLIAHGDAQHPAVWYEAYFVAMGMTEDYRDSIAIVH